MPTWCHMFNSTLIGNARVWFGDLPPESIDNYDDLKEAFLENYFQQKKCIKDLIEIPNIKQRDGESTEEFMQRYKLESRNVKGAPECMQIFGFMHEITNPELIKRLRPKIRNQMVPATTPLIGFSGEIKWPLTKITLLVKIGDDDHSTLAWINFVVVRASSQYNGIIRRPDKLDAILSLPSPKCLKDVQKLNGKLASLNRFMENRALRGLEINYTSMEKLVLALLHASKRLKEYFQAHPIIVITDQLIKHVLSSSKVAGRMQKWSIQLGEYGIHYRPRVSVKGKILSDFIVERREEESSDTLMEAEEELPAPWTLFTNGSSCVDGSGAGMILTNPEGMEFTYALQF
nr:reverse transcriptase domain-containing protein [Tanacetum cinerariifolium]